jgi:DNA-directed RNA polymerase sigma subunit (sigma70/sigma32)
LSVAAKERPDRWNRSSTVAVTKRTGGRRRSARTAQLPRAVDEGRESLDFYLQEISRIPLLKIEEETALARRAFMGGPSGCR